MYGREVPLLMGVLLSTGVSSPLLTARLTLLFSPLPARLTLLFSPRKVNSLLFPHRKVNLFSSNTAGLTLLLQHLRVNLTARINTSGLTSPQGSTPQGLLLSGLTSRFTPLRLNLKV